MDDTSPEVDEVLTAMPAWAVRGLLYILATFIAAILIWAHFSEIDMVVTAPGKIENGKVEATVRNRDIGPIEPGLNAKLKLDAYPFQSFGVVPARVTRIDRAGSDFQVVLEPERNTIQVHGRAKPLQDGLALTAEIVTDRQTLLSMLLRPFQKPGAAGGTK